MNGSTKQVTWAGQIKPELLRDVEAALAGMLSHREAAVAAGVVDGGQVALERAGGQRALALMEQVADAGWWINHRNARPGQALREVAQRAIWGVNYRSVHVARPLPGVDDLLAFWRITERL